MSRCRLAIGWGKRACRSFFACWILGEIFTWWPAWTARSKEKKKQSKLRGGGNKCLVSFEWCLTLQRGRWTLDAGWTRSAARWCKYTKTIWFRSLISCTAAWKIITQRLEVCSAFLSLWLFVEEPTMEERVNVKVMLIFVIYCLFTLIQCSITCFESVGLNKWNIIIELLDIDYEIFPLLPMISWCIWFHGSTINHYWFD